MYRIFNNLLMILFGVLLVNQTKAQCLNQVTNLSGSSMVGGVNVTVTSSGATDSNSTYCPLVTEPYFVGYNSVTGSADGSYTFQFSPAIDSLTLSFSGVSNGGIGQEIIVLNVNGLHYSIPNIGNLNGCDPLAELTLNGDITGCTGCGVSGWIDTSIPGPINTLTVLDSALWGQGNGAIFSLYICSAITTGIISNDKTNLTIFPNPAVDLLTISGLTGSNVKLRMQNSLGQKIVLNSLHETDRAIIDVSDLSEGVYFLTVEIDKFIETRKVIIK